MNVFKTAIALAVICALVSCAGYKSPSIFGRQLRIEIIKTPSAEKIATQNGKVENEN